MSVTSSVPGSYGSGIWGWVPESAFYNEPYSWFFGCFSAAQTNGKVCPHSRIRCHIHFPRPAVWQAWCWLISHSLLCQPVLKLRRSVFLFPFYPWENRGSKQWGDMSVVSQLEVVELRFEARSGEFDTRKSPCSPRRISPGFHNLWVQLLRYWWLDLSLPHPSTTLATFHM